jgi:signal peptidase I
VTTGEEEQPARAKKPHRPLWQETILLLVIAVVLALVLKTFFVQAFYIPSPSMVPGLVENDRILVEKPSYWFGGTPQRGDVVVFEDPGDWLPAEDKTGPTGTIPKLMSRIGLYPAGGHLVKRVIGVAGDTIVCCDEEGRLSVNGQPLVEDDYVNNPDSACRGPKGPGGPQRCSWIAGPVPAGDLFVMGDNRYDSADSSYHLCGSPAQAGCTPGDEYVADDLVVGRVFAVLWPRDHMAWLHRPETFSDVPDPS